MALFCVGSESWALSEPYLSSFTAHLEFFIERQPRYQWGGATDPDKGLDCSGYLYLAAKRAGIPGITRTTSLRMALGMGGWTGHDIELEDADRGDLVFWTFHPQRPHGHVGAVLRAPGGRLDVTHASFSRGRVVREALEQARSEDISKVRRLTIGEKP